MIPKIGSYNLSPYGFNQWTQCRTQHRAQPMVSEQEPKDHLAQIKMIGQAIHNWLIRSEQKAPLPPIVYLDNSNPRNHLIHLSQMSPDNALQSIATKEIVKLLPRENPIRLGYEDRIQYESVVGDYAIGGLTALTALGILSATFAKTFACMIHEEDTIEYVYAICKGKTATFWNGPSGKTILVGGALFLGASGYLHKKGWLGAWIHDPFLSRRSRQITALFQATAEELAKIKTTHPKAAKKIAENILTSSELIENTLLTELQLSAQTAKETTKILKIACKKVLLQKPTLSQEQPL